MSNATGKHRCQASAGVISILLIAAIILPVLTVCADAQKFGSEFQVHTTTLGEQRFSGISCDNTGKFIVVWEAENLDGSGYGVAAQRYDASGNKIGGVFIVNQTTAGNQRLPAVSHDASGNFAIAWTTLVKPQTVWCRIYDHTGTPVTGEFNVDPGSSFSHSEPDVSHDAAGNIYMVYTDQYGIDGDNGGIACRIFSPAGVPLGAPFLVNTTTARIQTYARIDHDTSGRAVIVWTGNQNTWWDAYGQRLTNTGVKAGSEFLVNTYTANNQSYADVSCDDSGEFFVVWQSVDQDGDLYGIYGQRYDAAGTKAGAEIAVNTTTAGTQRYPSVCTDGQGGYIAVWNGQDVSGVGVIGQLIASDGSKTGTEYQVNTYTAGDQAYPAIARGAMSQNIVVWQSMDQDGSLNGIYGQMFDFTVVAVMFQSFEAIRIDTGVELSWAIHLDETVRGINVYRVDGDNPVRCNGAPLRADQTSFTDSEAGDLTCEYMIGVVVAGGSEIFSGTVIAPANSPGLGLSQNYPNPFNPSTIIEYTLPEASSVSLRIFDAAGRLVTVIDEGQRPAGIHTVHWNGTGLHGETVASGVYFYELKTGLKERITKKMILMR